MHYSPLGFLLQELARGVATSGLPGVLSAARDPTCLYRENGAARRLNVWLGRLDENDKVTRQAVT